jgi:hypothetical protein
MNHYEPIHYSLWRQPVVYSTSDPIALLANLQSIARVGLFYHEPDPIPSEVS